MPYRNERIGSRVFRWFVFADEDEQCLTRLLGKNSALIADLESVVGWLRDNPDRPRLQGKMELTARERQDLTRLSRALKRLDRLLDDLHPETRSGLELDFDGSLLSRIDDRPVSLARMLRERKRSLPFGMSLKDWERSTLALGLIVMKLLEPRSPGKRPDTVRRSLCNGVRDVLVRHGIRVTKGRDSKFARTLAIVLDAAGMQVPGDMFYLVKQTVDGFGKPKRTARLIFESPEAKTRREAALKRYGL